MTFNVRGVRVLSQFGAAVNFWLTHTFLAPDGVLVIVGAAAEPVPPVATVYHNKLFPEPLVAVHTGAVPF